MTLFSRNRFHQKSIRIMGNKSLLAFVKEQWTTVPPVETADLAGKTVLVVGANTGIGFETAKHFALMGAGRVLMGCRSREKGDAAVRRLRESTGYDRAELWLVDLASFASVKAFADKFDKEVEKLDILVLNAAVLSAQYEETEDGWESSLQVNHLASALLILLLLPKVFKAAEPSVRSAPSPRIVIVASEVHHWATIPQKAFETSSTLEALSSKELSLPYDPRKKYHLAKLLNVFFARALAEHLPTSSTPVVNCVNPGFCYSELLRGVRSLATRLMQALLARTAEEGARQVIYASIGSPNKEDEDGMRGAYVSFAAIEEPSDFVISEKGKDFQNILWTDTLRVLSKIDPRVQPIITNYLKH